MNLTQRAVHGLKWQYGGTALQAALQFLIGVILARLLSPEAFGLVGIALLTVGFGRLLGDLGFGVAIIQRPSVTQHHIRAAFTGSVAMGLLLFGGLWCLAPAISRVFMQSPLVPILRSIAIGFVFSGMSAIPISLLRRDLRFRALASMETASYLLGYGGAGVPLAVLGCGVWSLVSANVLQQLSLAILAVSLAKQPLRPYFAVQEFHDLAGVASSEVLNNVTNHIAENFDFFVIGKWLGASALGLYSRSYYLMGLPVSHFRGALLRVMFPLYSTIQEDIPRLGQAYLRTVSLTALVTMPVLFAMAATPRVVLGGLFGEPWKGAAGALQILCLTGPLWAILCVGGALSHALGHVFLEWRRQVIYLMIVAVAVWFLLPLGVTGVALAAAFATLIRYLLIAQLAIRLARLSWKGFFRAQIPGYVLGVTVSATAFLASSLGDVFGISEPLQLFIITAACLVSLGISLGLFPASLLGELYPWANETLKMNFSRWIRETVAAKMFPTRTKTARAK